MLHYTRQSGKLMFKVILLSFIVLIVIPFDSFAQTRCRPDSLQNTTCRDSNGNTMRSRTDSLGNTTYRDSDGNTIHSRTDSLGNTTYRDNRGNTVRCHKDALGNTICR
ncbi:hypothetical protein NE2449 [Nitrosomonas europaea ATCC 19718]|uniref:YD repeat-containing protein n=1 Tax=Nitrosomonas europaea (strain ATCC 19718 / CIP 103999 / KCTC 2705 / NBRC 14298) TaxID=228410 RepID=Q82SA2_NITEU|nr:hypothetical protein NE2449 [Nitrosomonas europaea ATCC 19718]